MNKYEKQSIASFMDELEKSTNEYVDKSNTLNTELYRTIVDVQKETTPLVKKLSVVSDMLLDLKSITGNTKNTIDLTKNPVVYFKDNVIIDSNSFKISSSKTDLVEYIVADSSMRSFLPFTIKDVAGNLTNKTEALLYKKDMEVSFERKGFSFSLVLKYKSKAFINELIVQLGTTYRGMLPILSLKYIDENLVEIPIYVNGTSNQIDINSKLNKDNKYSFSFSTVYTDQLILEFSSPALSSFYLSSVVTNFVSYADKGVIICGPYSTKDPILKASISSQNKTSNVSVSVSSDLSSWIELDEITSLNLTNKSKIASFNTINEKSFKTEDDVKSLYIKFEFTTKENTMAAASLKTIKERNLTTSSSNIPEDKYTTYTNKEAYASYGVVFNKNNLNTNLVPVSSLDKIKVNNRTMFLGFIAAPFCVKINSTDIANITYVNKEKKVGFAEVSATDLDPVNYTIRDINILEVNRAVVGGSNKDIVYKLKVPEGQYKITTDTDSLILDLNTPYTYNTSSTILFVPDGPVRIFNELNQELFAIRKEDLKAVVYAGSEYKYLDLTDYLYNKIIVEGFVSTVLGEYTEIQTNEFVLIDGVLLFKGEAEVKCHELVKTIATYTPVISYTNGNYLKRMTSEFTTYNNETTVGSTESTAIKLNNIFIKKGTLVLEDLPSADTETYTPNLTPDINYLNIGTTEDPLYLNPDDTDSNIYLEI